MVDISSLGRIEFETKEFGTLYFAAIGMRSAPKIREHLKRRPEEKGQEFARHLLTVLATHANSGAPVTPEESKQVGEDELERLAEEYVSRRMVHYKRSARKNDNQTGPDPRGPAESWTDALRRFVECEVSETGEVAKSMVRALNRDAFGFKSASSSTLDAFRDLHDSSARLREATESLHQPLSYRVRGLLRGTEIPRPAVESAAKEQVEILQGVAEDAATMRELISGSAATIANLGDAVSGAILDNAKAHKRVVIFNSLLLIVGVIGIVFTAYNTFEGSINGKQEALEAAPASDSVSGSEPDTLEETAESDAQDLGVEAASEKSGEP